MYREERLLESDTVPDTTLKALMDLAAKATEIQARINLREARLEQDKEELKRLLDNVIPDMMESVGQESFTAADGSFFRIDRPIYGSLPKDRDKRALALDYLRRLGGEELIKTEVVAEFEKGQDNLAGHFMAELETLNIRHDKRDGVHHKTLASFAKELNAKGVEYQPELLGLFIGRRAKIDLA